MNDLIKYETCFSWVKYPDISSELCKRLKEDIKSFNPVIPIQMTSSKVFFNVDNVNDKPNIELKLSVNRHTFGDEPIANYGNLLDETIVRRLKDILFTINIAYPGCVEANRNILYRDGQPTCTFSFSSYFSGMTHEKCKWITYEKLTLTQCWDWIVQKTNFLSYISRNSIDRALNALSYESDTNEDQYVFYALLGIEAIYNNGGDKDDSISSQLRKKIQAVIGELPSTAIKEIKKMYKMRSALVHGNANFFKCWPSEDFTDDEYDEVMKDHGYMITATGILIATIQRFIKNNATTLVEETNYSLR